MTKAFSVSQTTLEDARDNDTASSDSGSSNTEEEEDYFTKFNTLAGWQSILLLQFQIQLKMAVLLSIYLAYVSSIVQAALALGCKEDKPAVYSEQISALNGGMYIGDVIYFLDCISMIVFRRVEWTELNIRYKKRPAAIVFIEVLTTIPLEPCYGVMVQPSMKIMAFLRLRYVVRVIRLWTYFREAGDYVGNNSYLLHILVYLGFCIIAISTSASVSYTYKCKKSPEMCLEYNMTVFTESLFLACNTWSFIGMTPMEGDDVLDSLWLTTLAFLVTAVFTGHYTCGILRRIKSKFNYMNSYMWYKRRIQTWRLTYVKEWTSYQKKYETLVDQYNTVVWERTQGNTASAYFGKFLPLIMYKEIFLDVSWVPLKHSHLFRNEEVCFLRLISQIVIHKFFCPGEVIYKRDQFKDEMIYIISGIADILSEEDGETPIMSLSSGTCLGESTLIISYPSISTVVSKNICDVVVLRRKDFINLTHLYPEKMKRAQCQIRERYARARGFRHISEYQFNGNQEFDDRIGVLTMKWLKHTLRSLLFNVQKMGDVLNRHYLKKLDENVFCTAYLDLLTPAEDEELTSETIFVRMEFPFVFRPHSILLKIWNATVLFCVLYMLVTFPYFFAFSLTLDLSCYLSFILLSLIWIVDMYLRSSTAIQTKYLSYNTVGDIVGYNLGSFTYMLDICAIIPFECLVYFLEGYWSKNGIMLGCMNRLIKAYKIESFFSSVKVSTQRFVYITVIKFICYLAITLYYLTTICYLLGQLDDNYLEYEKYVAKFDATNSVSKRVFVCFFGVLEYYFDLNLAGFPFFNGVTSRLTWCTIQMCLVIFNVCFMAYLAAAVTMNMQDKHTMEEFVRDIAITMKCYNIQSELQDRLWEHIHLQYEHTGVFFLIGEELFSQLPRDLFVMSRGIELSNLLKNQPLFYMLEEVIISHIASATTRSLVPAGEVVKRTGELCPEMHFIRDGVLKVIDHKNESKSIEAGDCFCVLEACLHTKSMLTIVAETPCSIVSLSIVKLKAVLLHYSLDHEQLTEAIEMFPYWDVIENYAWRTETKHEEKHTLKRKEYKFFGYFLKKRSKSYNIFQEGFTRCTVIGKYLLLRIVFSSSGHFVFCWEAARITFAFLTAVSVPIIEFVSPDNTACFAILRTLDVTAYFDLYMRQHFSYYNIKGIEIMHPFKTALHYWKSAFVLDLFACLPLEIMFASVASKQSIISFRFNRFLQLYRYHHFIDQMYGSKFNVHGLFLLLKYIPYFGLIINFSASCVLRFFCTFRPVPICLPKTCFASKINATTSMTDIYGFGVYVTTVVVTSINQYQIRVGTIEELVFITIAAMSGIVVYYIFLAKIIEGNLTINRDLSIYQEAMKTLNVFLSYRKIDQNLKRELINHFEYMWDRTKGKNIINMFHCFKHSFKVDSLYKIYGESFKRSSIFESPNEAFFRSLLIDAHHEMYLKTGFVYSVNDVSGDIYILFKGKVEVVGADGNRLTTLYPGSVFGNIDNCPLGRRTLSIVASGHVEVLRFKTASFYEHLSKFPHLYRYFKKLTIFDTDFLSESKNLNARNSGIKVTTTTSQLISTSTILRKRALQTTKVFDRNQFIDVWENFIIGFLACLSYILELYHVATLEDSIGFFCVIYFVDFLFVVKIYMMFHTSYEDEYGHIVYSHSMIAKRYMKKRIGFFLDLFTTFPIELLTLSITDPALKRFLFPIFRLNRLPRVIIVITYLRSLTQKLNINVVLVRLVYLVIWTCLAIVTLGSTLKMLDYNYYPTFYERNTQFHKSVQSIVNACKQLATVMEPRDLPLYWTLWMTILMICCKCIFVLFLTECCAILVVVNHTRNSYEQYLFFVKNFMVNENVSLPLAEKIINYIQLLWAYHKGGQFPVLLEKSPYYLREAVLNSMFGYHLDNHPVLRHIHKDLARQMTAQMKTLVFFPGDKVTYVGDIDHCMYFVDEGEVMALSEDTMYSEVVAKAFKTGDMFGLEQGIQMKLGHQYTYKVSTYSVLVALKRDEWIELLDFFPASRTLIYEAVNKRTLTDKHVGLAEQAKSTSS